MDVELSLVLRGLKLREGGVDDVLTEVVSAPSVTDNANAMIQETQTSYSLAEVCAAFNSRSPVPRSRRTVQRWLVMSGVQGFGTSRHNWFYPAQAVALALDRSFARKPKSKGKR